MSNDTPEYVTHDFSAVDNQILEIAKREKARTFAFQLESIRLIFLYSLAAALMAALLLLVMSWSYRILNEPYVDEIVKIVKPEIIEKEVLKIIEVPVREASNSKFPSTVIESSSNSSEEATNSNVVTNYNVFRNVETPEFERFGISAVTTGWTYSSSTQDFPEAQYCYVLKFDQGNVTPSRISLADMSGGVIESVINQAVADETNISMSTLENLQSYCSWAWD
jgi:hypothetical protein|tara:strand:- start:141 stop:809 length:669 start_codon:yes stop_codon:yes gene_type:complete